MIYENIKFDDIFSRLENGSGAVSVVGLNQAARAYFTARAYQALGRSILVVAPTSAVAEKFSSDLRYFLESDQPTSGWKQRVFLLPDYEVLPFQGVSPPVEVSARRIATMYALQENDGPVITVTSPLAVMQRVIPRSEMNDHAELIMVQEETDRETFIKHLVEGGYFRTSLVEQKGDFSVRGDLLDLYPPHYEYPVRIEFFGDFVESIRLFEVSTQRSFADLTELIALPVSELIRSESHVQLAIKNIQKNADTLSQVRQMTAALHTGSIFPGAESFLSFFYEKPESILDYLPEDTLIAMVEPSTLETRALVDQEQIRPLVSPLGDLGPYREWKSQTKDLSRFRRLNFNTIHVEGEAAGGDVYRVPCEGNEDIKLLQSEAHEAWDKTRKIVHTLKEWMNIRAAVNWVSHGARRSRQLHETFSEYGFRIKIENPPLLRAQNDYGVIRIVPGTLSQGFRLWTENVVVLTDDELFGPKKRIRKSSRSRLDAYVSSFEDLKEGDYIVHVEHGIGKYQGLFQLTVDDVPNDFLLIQYKDADKLYIPVHNLKVIQKYVGLDGQAVRLDKLGGKSWSTVKSKVRKSVEKLALELLQTFAQRSASKGHAFSTNNGEMREFEEGFPYEETPDQLRAIEDVIADMEAENPMDRLICGDVGYGKTEVAMRAAFKCVLEGKQVCFLVPTTVLAAQHYETFAQRFKDHAVQVRSLSRFLNPKEQKVVLEELTTGSVDIVIGTHRLLSKDVAFKDLGLLIVDEEHRFGVAHKERIKKLKALVDVLTLTATPIPRTLHMALLGIRDLSTIETPPRDRLAIKTYIAKYDERVIKGAIEREMQRGGQVFFVHNRVQNIDITAGHVRRLVPQARIGIAHGQLKERELEKVMMKFLKREIDVLVCTVIIESGLDIPSANTIIINQADRYGLAQMYQLRGRVGRSNERAYAYLLIAGESVISEEAKKRLKVLMDFTELGAGFKIAFHDLQIRGGGEILGPAQSGHIAAVGYEMYLQLLEESINELKGEQKPVELDPEINLRIPAFIPDSFIRSIDQRLGLYKRISNLDSEESIEDMRDEIEDRFGAPPQELLNLLELINLKILLRNRWIKRLDLNGDNLIFSIAENHEGNFDKVLELVQKQKNKYRITPEGALFVRLKPGQRDPVMEAKKTLQELF